MRTVIDSRARNANTRKLASPLPDIETILRNVAAHPYCSLIDGKDAYEQIRVEPEHVPRTLFTTPDGTMVSEVMQMGDCNGGATYQTLMTYIFAPYIGVYMDVYMDDIVIYSDTPDDHVIHVKSVLDILGKEQLYLSKEKLHFFVERLKILGHVIDGDGIALDPNKVDSILNWKIPTNRELLVGFLGAVGYLASGCHAIRIPMGCLTRLTSKMIPWRWTPTEQCAFDEVRMNVEKWRHLRRVNLDYNATASPINLTCDACNTGGSGVISQGHDLETARIIAFWSGKFNSAQQNYPVHEQELLAIVESLKRFRNLLHGARFRIFTDHKALEFLQTQKNLSPRQTRWLETLSDFDFTIEYIPGETNILADALSCVYSADPVGTVRAASEYVVDDDEAAVPAYVDRILDEFSRPVFTDPSTVMAFVLTTPSTAKPVNPPESPDSISDSPQTSPMPHRASKRVILKVRNPDGTIYTAPPLSLRTEGANSRSKKQSSRTQTTMATHQNDDHVRAQGTTTTPNISEAGNKGDIECTADQHSTLRDTIDDDIQFPQSAEEELLSSVAPQLTAVLADGHPEYNIPHCLIGQYATDTFFKPIAEQPDRFKQFYRHDGLIFLSNSDRRILCVPDVSIGTHKVRELIISQAHSILAHLGSQKTLYYLKDNVWWPGLTADVKAYCESCRTCATSKSNTTAPYGLLHPLAVPDRPWDVIGVDFVGPLPESRTRTGIFDMICVIIDHFTYMVHLVPSVQTYRARDIAELMFDTVYKLHGIPRKIVSDRDSLFTGQFWEQLNKLVGVDLRRSSAYHPQSDGLTERTNRTLGQMLRQCVSPNQKDWAAKLPAIEFALNSARSDSTGFSPFFLNAGRVPRPMIWDSSSQYPGVRAFAGKMKDALLAAHDALLAARVKMTRQANRHRRPTPFVVGDLAYLSTKNLSLPKGRSRKLFPKYIGPFRILQDFGNSTFRLELPADLRRRGVQSSFHASLLRVHHPNDDRRFPGRQLDQLSGFNDHPHEWAVDRIRTHHGAGRTALFELQWKSGDVSWAPYDDVAHLEALGTYLELLGVTGISKLTTGTAPPPADPELRVSAAGFDKSYQSAYKKNVDSPTQLQLSSLTMPRQWTLAQLRAFATYAEQLHAAGNSGPAAPSPAPEHYDAWAASTQQSISDLPPVPTSQPTTHVAEHVTNTVSADAARTQTMADEWVELGRIAINDLVKNR